jgi:DNA-binding CsgD family transcriptional regulator
MPATIHSPAPTTSMHFTRPEGLSENDILQKVLHQMDYGLVVVEVDRAVVQMTNACGQRALSTPSGEAENHHGLCLFNGRVSTCFSADSETLERTLQRTRAGLRGLLSLGPSGKGMPVAVVPLSPAQLTVEAVNRKDFRASELAPCYALLVFAKQHLCDDSTIALYARERGLTSAEGHVLAQICKGMRPSEIAAEHGVQISTVRTQLRSIRMKTSCDTIRELVQQVSILPPIAMHLSMGQTRP